MELTLKRLYTSDQRTIGELYVDGAFECYTLEDAVRPDPNPATPENEAKVPGRTAIPTGKYRVTMGHSPKFGYVPFVHDVPGFTYIRFHAGNTEEDTEGCILVGQVLPGAKDRVLLSRPALQSLIAKIKEPCWLTIQET